MTRFVVLALLALTLSASAQSIGGMSGIGGGIGGSSSAPVVACTTGNQLDFSDACNLVLAGH